MDYVVCAHKAIDQDEVAAQLKPVIDPSRTTIVVIQNGVGNEEPFRTQFPQNSIITCVVSIPQAICYNGTCLDETNDSRLGWEPYKPAQASSST
jgi:ketopantoate reductase